MASVFDQVAESLGHGWREALSVEMKAYIDRAIAGQTAGELSDEIKVHIQQLIEAEMLLVDESIAEIRALTTIEPDPQTPGSYLIGE